MKSRKSWWGIIGSIAMELVLFIDLGIDLHTGEMTYRELILLLMFCAILAVTIHFFIMRRKRKK